jgi:hypothetical protein
MFCIVDLGIKFLIFFFKYQIELITGGNPDTSLSVVGVVFTPLGPTPTRF